MQYPFPIPGPPERRRAARPASGTAPRPTKKRPTQATATKKRPTGPTQARAAAVSRTIVVVMLSTDLLDANDYNANEMTPEQLAEYRAEVQRLGRPPRPLVVRKKGDRYEVIEGEHALKIARDLHLAAVPCEVIQADDFEAIRENFKRNQHGACNPVKQGRAFERMQQARGLSNRKLAEALGIPEATLRSYLGYVRAVGVRNSCAADTAEADIARLSVRQVQHYLHLPERGRDAWLDRGAVLPETKPQTEKAGPADGEGGRQRTQQQPAASGNETVNETTNETANETADDEENADRSQDEGQSGLEQDEADAAEAPAARTRTAQAGTKNDATDNVDDVLQGLKTALTTLARFEGPLTRLRATLSPEERARAVGVLKDISRLAGRMVGLCVEDQPTSPPSVV